MTSQKFVSVTVGVACLLAATVIIALFVMFHHNKSTESNEFSRKFILNNTIDQNQTSPSPAYSSSEHNTFLDDDEKELVTVTPLPKYSSAEQNTITDDDNTEVLITVTPSPASRTLHKFRHMKHKIHREVEKVGRSSKINTDKTAKRNRAKVHTLGLNKKSCPSRTAYVFKKTAEDMFGDTVDIYPVIHVGKLVIDQHFYETFCDVEKCQCAGVDNEKFESACQTTHSYMYARIVKGGEVGWSFIKLRSGCSCNVKEKIQERFSIMDLRK